MSVGINIFCVIVLTIAAVAFTWLATRFRYLENSIVLSIEDVLLMMALLKNLDNVETTEQYIAKLMKLSPEEAKREVERGNLMNLVAKKAACIEATLRAAMPDTYKKILGSVQAEQLTDDRTFLEI